LLIVDNCEHVIDSAAELAHSALTGAENVYIIATSREPLRVGGEMVVHLEPLAVPDESAAFGEVLASPSGRLFVDRVSSADARFQLETRDVHLIRTICRRLDGIPLALELAAARVPTLGLQQIADRLDDRFGLLTVNNRHAIAHHQTLRAAIEWSIDLLDPPRRRFLAALSVFVGGFDLDAAESVQGSATPSSASVADTVAMLVDRSLVVAFWTGREVRYRLLETIREYATVELGPDTESIRQRHCDHYLRLARSIGDGFLIDTERWYHRLRLEFPNLRAAFRWSMDRADVTTALDLAVSLRWAPFNTGHLYREHREWIDAALAAGRDTGIDHDVLGRALVAAGSVAGLESRSSDAIGLLSEAIELLSTLDAANEIVWCRMWLGAFCVDRGEYVAGVEHTRLGLELARSRGSPTEIVYLANQHGENAMAASSFDADPALGDEARAAFSVAITAADEHHIDEGLVRARNGLAVLDAPDDPSSSLQLSQELLTDWRRLGQGNRLIMSLVAAARVAVLAGDTATMSQLITEALDAIAAVGWRQPLGRLIETSAVAAIHRDDTAVAAVLAGAASNRFLTPRWFVPLAAEQHYERACSRNPQSWNRDFSHGASMPDTEVIALIRSTTR